MSLPFEVKILKKNFSFRGKKTPDQELCPWALLGALPQTPLHAHACHVSPPVQSKIFLRIRRGRLPLALFNLCTKFEVL